MDLHIDCPKSGLSIITSYGVGYIEVNHLRFLHSIIVSSQMETILWPVEKASDIELAHLQQAASLQSVSRGSQFSMGNKDENSKGLSRSRPEILLIGTGSSQQLSLTKFLKPLSEINIAVEIMNTYAAARTYNILATEGRRVSTGLIIPEP